ncbi:MAG TPA: cyclic nucleotide-binding domain-containing protein [Myxococcales bacterium]|nr:cyclic nucleotide-binding domain-containing protein [Myxococcales bacterium]
MDRSAVLRSMALLRDFTDVGLKILAESSVERAVGRGTYAFRAGEPSQALAFVVRGTLQLVPTDGGSPIGEVTAGDCLGGLSLLVDGDRVLSAVALDDVELLELSRSAFEAIKRTHPRTALKLTLCLAQDLAERLRQARAPLREFLSWQLSRQQAEGR